MEHRFDNCMVLFETKNRRNKTGVTESLFETELK